MALYEKLEYELEFITPAFIGGAFPDKEAELRPASFIGILRWWFRNLALTVTDDIEAVARLESELFGNQNRAGKVWVKVEPIEGKIEVSPEDIKKILLNTVNYLYLGYGNILFISFCKRGRPNLKNINKYFYILKKENCLKRKEIKQPFEIRTCKDIEEECYSGNFLVKDFLISYGKPTHKLTILVPRKYKPLLESLLFLVSHLGGIGSRNRRGWGSFYLGNNFFVQDHLQEHYNNFKEKLLEKLKKLNNKTEKPINKPLQKISFFITNLESSNPLELLYQFADKYRIFRNRKDPDYCLVKFQLAKKINRNIDSSGCNEIINQYKNFITDSIIYNRAWFGLPIITTYNSLSRATDTINLFDEKEKDLRLASPLIVRVVKTDEKSYELLLILIDNPNFYESQKIGDKEIYKWSFPQTSFKAKNINKSVFMEKSLEDFIIKDFLTKQENLKAKDLTQQENLIATKLFTWGKKNEKQQ